MRANLDPSTHFFPYSAPRHPFPGSANDLTLPHTIVHSHKNRKVGSLSVQGCPLIIQKGNLRNDLKHLNGVKNYVKLQKTSLRFQDLDPDADFLELFLREHTTLFKGTYVPHLFLIRLVVWEKHLSNLKKRFRRQDHTTDLNLFHHFLS